MPSLAGLASATICTGFAGAGIDDAVIADIRELAPGAFVLFARNVSDIAGTRALVAAVRDAANDASPALVCLDQEGGRVARLRFGGELPTMLALGATDDAVLAERAGARLASELRAIGANVDFAPVLDLALEPRSTVIGTRSLGDDPARVAALGVALVRGLQGAGVAASVKHFPGHGGTGADSHVTLPEIATDAATLRARDLVPFRAAFAAGARAVMTAHVVFRALDPTLPATLSPIVLTELLRSELGFRGVCFTDCMQMDAIARGVGTARGAALALAAGADCIVVGNDLALAREARDAIVQSVRSGTLALERLEEAADRVETLRRSLASHAASTDDYPCDDALAREIARRAIVVVRGDPVLDPARPVTVVSFEGDDADGVAASRSERPSLSLALRRRKFRSEMMRVNSSPDETMLEMLLDVVRAQGERTVVIVARRAHLRERQRVAIDALLGLAPGAVAISALEPFDVEVLRSSRTVLCSFGDDEANIEALGDILAGRTNARGTPPIARESRA